MTNKKRLSFIAAALLVIGLVGSLVTYQSTNEFKEVSEQKTITGSQVTAIDINSDNSRIEIWPTTEQDVNIQLSGKTAANVKPLFTANVEDSTLFIRLDEDQNKWFNFNFHDYKLTLKVYLPEKQYNAFKIANNNGYILAQKLTATTIQATTNNGRIELSESTAQEVKVKTDNGKVTLTHVTGVLNGKANNGSITVLTKEISQNITLETDNGRILLQTETEPADVSILTHVDNGRVNLFDKYKGDTVVGNGKTVVKLTANNGSITVKKQ